VEEVELTGFITSPIVPRRTIPVERREAARDMRKTEEVRKTILVVEDDELTVRMLRKVLEAWDARVEVAQNGKEALPKLAKERFDLLVCDILMPEMNGQELFRYIQTNAYLPPEHILFLTGDKSATVKQFMDGTGCSYFYKPLEFLDFSSHVQTLLAEEDTCLTAV
jgi:CheY-like chemotaxis protein